MTKHRTFTTEAEESAEPITFDIDGEVFTCKGFVPGTVLIEYGALLLSGEISIAASALLSFYSRVMEDGEAKRFMAFVEDPARKVDVQLLGRIMQFLLEEYGGLPFGRSQASEPGSATAGTTSTGS